MSGGWGWNKRGAFCYFDPNDVKMYESKFAYVLTKL